MEWNLIGSGDAPAGFENVSIDDNNLSEHREILRTLAMKAIEDGTIKLCKKAETTQPKDETVLDDDIIGVLDDDIIGIPYHESKEYLDTQKEWQREWEEKFLKEIEEESCKKEMEMMGVTPLMMIAMRGTAETCKKLISEGAEIDKMSKVEFDDNENNFNGTTALMVAAMTGELENFKCLMSAGADISKETPAESGNGGCTALHCAARHGHLEICKLLVSAGANIDKESLKGLTPLMYAAKNNNLKLCKLLVSAGADIHKESKMGWTPLMFAASGKYPYSGNDIGQWDICKFFINAGADVNKKNKDGLNLIMIALNSEEDIGISELCSKLALFEPDMPKKAILNPNTLTCAAGKGSSEICELFIMLGADVDKEDKDGWTPLMKAAYNDRDTTCEILISSGANVDKEVLVDKEAMAESHSNDRIAEFLISKGVNEDKEVLPGKEPATPLMLAVNKGHTRIAKILLKAGANTDKISKEKLEILKEKSDGNNSPTTVKEDTSSADKDKEETPVYDTCKNIDEAENLTEACNLKIDKSDDNAMTALLEKCKNLISAGANLDVLPYGSKVNTPLMNAASHGYTEICKMLIAAGVDVNDTERWNTTALILAAESGHREICEMLISAGAKIEHKNMPRETALSKAMRNHHIETCRFLISAGSPIPYYDETEGYTTALMYAAENNMTEICDLLITSMGANIEEENKNGETALMKAAECGAAEACRFLISEGANIEKEDNNGNTALIKASDNINVCKEFISGGANINKQTSSGKTVMMATRTPEILMLLISARADLNLQDLNGQTALTTNLSWILRCGEMSTEQREILQILIHYTDLNLHDSKGETALMKATKDGFVDICALLIVAGADVTMETSEKSELRGYAAMHFAVLYAQEARYGNDNYKEIFKMLISAGANIDQETAEGWTPLMLAAKTEYSLKICRELISGGADINKKSKDGWTPLMITLNKDHRSYDGDIHRVCPMLIKLGADITTGTMPNGKTLLSCAARNYELYDICETLILRGADVNKEDEDGWTPLMKAAYKNNSKICKLLIAAGANVDKEILLDDKKKATSLMLAARKGKDKICNILVSAGANILSTTHYSG